MSVRPYVTEEEGRSLQVSCSFLQSWHHDFSLFRTRNEAMTIRWYLTAPLETRQLGLEILTLLARFRFATRDQIHLLLRGRHLDPGEADRLLDEYLTNRVLNLFTLARYPLDRIPADAMKIYCLDYGARHILLHYYREDFVYWQSPDNLRSAEQVVKCLSTLWFYLQLLQTSQESLRVFAPMFDVTIGRRDARFSACFEITRGLTCRRFLLESVRDWDVPVYWRKKVSEQITPFLEQQFWQRVMPEEPVFLLLCQSPDTAREAADLFQRRTRSDRFRVTLDSEIAKGMEKALFFRYQPAPEGIGTLTPVRATLFSGPSSQEVKNRHDRP